MVLGCIRELFLYRGGDHCYDLQYVQSGVCQQLIKSQRKRASVVKIGDELRIMRSLHDAILLGNIFFNLSKTKIINAMNYSF